MELQKSYGEIKKTFNIDKFSSYIKTDDKIGLEFHMILDEFRSKWKITIYPMYDSKADYINLSSVNCDVTIDLVCLSSSAPCNIIKEIQIECLVNKRENYPVSLHIDQTKELPTWKNAIISRVTLESLRIVENDNFEYHIIFKIPDQLLNMSEDGKSSVSNDMKKILTDPEFYDVCLLSSDDSKFYVHSCILNARSNIMKTGKPIYVSQDQLQEHCDKAVTISCEEREISKLERLNNYENEINGIYNSPQECTNSYTSQSTNSSESSYNNLYSSSSKCRKPLFVMSTNPFDPDKAVHRKDTITFPSPIKSQYESTASPKRKKGMNALTPKKHSGILDSPKNQSDSSQKKLTQFFPRSSTMNTHVESSIIPLSSFSPIGMEKSCANTPNREPVSSHYFSPSYNNRNITPSKIQNFESSSNPGTSTIRSSSGITPRKSVQNLKRKLFDNQTDKNRDIAMIKLNISQSVLQEILCWIYSGECSLLHTFARVLLAAAHRHSIKDLFIATQLHLSSIVCIENAADLLRLSHKYEAHILFDKSMEFAVMNASSITCSSSWESMCAQHPEIILTFTRKLASVKS